MRDRTKQLLVINTGEKKQSGSGSQTIINQYSSYGSGGSGVDLRDYLLKRIWDTAWELRTTEEGESYIFCKLPFVSQHGVTLYADGGNIDLPSLYAGIPFDNRTIWLNPETKLVEVIGGTGGGEGGVSNFWDLTNIPKWITATKPEYLYGEIKDTPDLSEYAKITDVDRRINDLVNGAPAAYDTLKEIADVLQGNVNSIGDIITTLGTKADKTELTKYIPIAGDTEVTGIKNFLNGLKIGGLPISKYEGHDDVIYIDANVVLRGGLTQYAVDPVTIPSIIESLPQAGYEAKGVASFSDKYFTISAEGKVSIIPDSVGLNEEELEAWLANSDYATKTYVVDTFATKSSLNATNAEVAKKWTQDDDKIANWDSAYGWGNHAIAGYFLANNFTKVNIVAKLGISDWALAATKPSYTTKEVTEDTNLYFTNQRAIDALTDTLKAYVTLKGTQTIEGEKDFTGGLKVNGSPIVYDSEKGYWKLQGNLLITGGLTQYVDDGSVDLPNLYDGLPIDGSTIYWDNGVLKAKYTEGSLTAITKDMVIEALGFTPYNSTNPNGYITSAALNGYATQTWVNQQGFLTEHQDLSGYQTKITSTNKLAYSLISGTPDLSVYLTTSSASSTYQPKITSSAKLAASLVSGLATVATSGSYNDLSNKPTIPTNTNQLTNGAGFITSSALSSYLPLSGGTLSGRLYISNSTNDTPLVLIGTASSWIHFTDSSQNSLGYIGFNASAEPAIYKGSNAYKIWYSGNFTPSNYLPLSGGTLTDNLALKSASASANTPKLYFQRGTTADDYYDCYIYNTGGGLTFGYSSSGTDYDLVKVTSTTLRPNSNNTYDLGASDYKWANIYATLINGGTPIHSNNIGSQNVASATKLQTARTIWGQSFDGTGNVRGTIYVTNPDATTIAESSGKIKFNSIHSNDTYRSPYIQAIYYGNYSRKRLGIFQSNATNYTDDFVEVLSVLPTGNVGIGTTSPSVKLDVRGSTLIDGTTFIAAGSIGFNRNTVIGGRFNTSFNGWQWHVDTSNSKFCCYTEGTSSGMKFTLDTSGNGLFYGGITQYSDIRKKTKLNDVELTLKQVANAPLIEHYYNSDDKKTTHVGSIAQYWADMNDWFCKLDSDGYYTMEIQNAALASAISVARELERYESKTDKKIRLLKKRINELEDEIEILKKGA